MFEIRLLNESAMVDILEWEASWIRQPAQMYRFIKLHAAQAKLTLSDVVKALNECALTGGGYDPRLLEALHESLRRAANGE